MTGPSPDQIARGRVTTKQEIVHIHDFLSGSSGYLVDAHGLHSLPGNAWAVQDTPAPQDLSQLQPYLGLLSYYSKFHPNLSTVSGALHQLFVPVWHIKGVGGGKCFSSLEATAGVDSVVGAL